MVDSKESPEDPNLVERLADYQEDKADLRIAADAAVVDDLTQAAAYRRQLGQRIDAEIMAGGGGSPAVPEEAEDMAAKFRIRSPETHNYYPAPTPAKAGISPVVSALVTAALLAGGGLGGAGLMALLSRAPVVAPLVAPAPAPAPPEKKVERMLIELLD